LEQSVIARDECLPASFRDPCGFLFSREGVLYRQVNVAGGEDYDLLMSSGLYDALAEKRLMVGHEEVNIAPPLPKRCHKVIRPERIPFVSYPYEWCFSQMQHAALLTLRIQKLALEKGMVLKDASAYNIQFCGYRPVLIDTLSFERYREGEPWVAYRQFCQHFLAPLALMAYTDIRLSQLLRVHMDGIPLDLAAALLPFRTRMKFSLLSHVHVHARSQKHYGGRKVDVRKLMDSLESAVRTLSWKPHGTEWAAYYEETNYSAAAFAEKKRIVSEILGRIRPETVLDLGANTGVFSRLAAEMGSSVLSVDMDPGSVEQNYLQCRAEKAERLLPLLIDLANPSSPIGWAGTERSGWLERTRADMVLALALIHHLAISNNVPLGRLAAFLAGLGKNLVVEFVPKSDPQVQRLLVSRKDVFADYTQETFENEFLRYFVLRERHAVADTGRTLYFLWQEGGRFFAVPGTSEPRCDS
jgi:ribosomal protein L11 methylase PrmA